MFGDEVYDIPFTVISKEYSIKYSEGLEPYYPINNQMNENLANSYLKMADFEKDVIFGGRLGRYKYYDMAPIIEEVLSLAEAEFISI